MTAWDRYRLAFRTAVVTGVFAIVVGVLLLADYTTRVAKDPLNSPRFALLKQQLAADPQNEDLKQELRALDLELRQAYFRRREFAGWGTSLLVAGVVLCLVAAKWAATLNRKLPTPAARCVPEDVDQALGQTGRWAVAAFAGLGILAAIGLAAGFRSVLPADARQLAALEPADGAQPPPPSAAPGSSPLEVRPSPEPARPAADPQQPVSPPEAEPQVKPKIEPPAADYPTLEEIQANWPRFRGPGGLGISNAAKVPTQWNVETGEGIRWKVPVPLPGNNSPVIWGQRLFLTGADDAQREVYCYDTQTGQLLWQQELPATPDSPAEVPEVMEATGLAASTATTDGRRVYAIFANGDVGAFDFDGKLAWSRSLGLPKNAYGHASSLDMYQDLLIVQFDQGTKRDKLSKLLALRGATGETVWETPREVPNSWPTPLVVRQTDPPQIIACADPWVIAYSPADGKELWRADCLKADVGPSPVFADGLVVVANEFPGVAAIRADGTGDVTETHVAWTADQGVPDCCSPIATEKFVLLLASYGILTCYDAQQGGDPLWEHEFDDAAFASSPTMAGSHLYVFDEEGKVWILEPTAEECQPVAENNLGEGCVTSPAFHQDRMYVRGKEHLFCIGEKE